MLCFRGAARAIAQRQRKQQRRHCEAKRHREQQVVVRASEDRIAQHTPQRNRQARYDFDYRHEQCKICEAQLNPYRLRAQIMDADTGDLYRA